MSLMNDSTCDDELHVPSPHDRYDIPNNPIQLTLQTTQTLKCLNLKGISLSLKFFHKQNFIIICSLCWYDYSIKELLWIEREL